jgi:hypothetical protein
MRRRENPAALGDGRIIDAPRFQQMVATQDVRKLTKATRSGRISCETGQI